MDPPNPEPRLRPLQERRTKEWLYRETWQHIVSRLLSELSYHGDERRFESGTIPFVTDDLNVCKIIPYYIPTWCVTFHKWSSSTMRSEIPQQWAFCCFVTLLHTFRNRSILHCMNKYHSIIFIHSMMTNMWQFGPFDSKMHWSDRLRSPFNMWFALRYILLIWPIIWDQYRYGDDIITCKVICCIEYCPTRHYLKVHMSHQILSDSTVLNCLTGLE